MLKTFKELTVWQKAFRLCSDVYRLTARYPSDERFGLTAQTRRAAVSIPANIAEGYGRGTTRDDLRFLWMANGSVTELETHLLIARDLQFVSTDASGPTITGLADVERLLKALIRALEKKTQAPQVQKNTEANQ